MNSLIRRLAWANFSLYPTVEFEPVQKKDHLSSLPFELIEQICRSVELELPSFAVNSILLPHFRSTFFKHIAINNRHQLVEFTAVVKGNKEIAEMVLEIIVSNHADAHRNDHRGHEDEAEEDRLSDAEADDGDDEWEDVPSEDDDDDDVDYIDYGFVNRSLGLDKDDNDEDNITQQQLIDLFTHLPSLKSAVFLGVSLSAPVFDRFINPGYLFTPTPPINNSSMDIFRGRNYGAATTVPLLKLETLRIIATSFDWRCAFHVLSNARKLRGLKTLRLENMPALTFTNLEDQLDSDIPNAFKPLPKKSWDLHTLISVGNVILGDIGLTFLLESFIDLKVLTIASMNYSPHVMCALRRLDGSLDELNIMGADNVTAEEYDAQLDEEERNHFNQLTESNHHEHHHRHDHDDDDNADEYQSRPSIFDFDPILSLFPHLTRLSFSGPATITPNFYTTLHHFPALKYLRLGHNARLAAPSLFSIVDPSSPHYVSTLFALEIHSCSCSVGPEQASKFNWPPQFSYDDGMRLWNLCKRSDTELVQGEVTLHEMKEQEMEFSLEGLEMEQRIYNHESSSNIQLRGTILCALGVCASRVYCKYWLEE